MNNYIASLAALSTLLACGGTTGSGDGPFDGGAASGGSASSGAGGKGSSGSNQAGSGQGGTSSAGNSSGGRAQGGVSSGGVSSGGVSSGGVSSGGVNSGGVSSGGVSSGGVPGVDPRCPPITPSGVCSDEGLRCDYTSYNNCLCLLSGAYCEPVDNTCTGAPAREGTGGFSAKIAAPTPRRCTCSADGWMCVLGF